MAREEKKGLGGFTLTKLLVLGGIVALLVVCAVSISNIVKLHGEQAELKAENERLQAEKENLETELKNVNDLDYIEEQARKQLKMIKPGEVLFVLDESGVPHVVEPDENGVLPKPENPGGYGEESEEVYQEETYQEESYDEGSYEEEYVEPEYVEETESQESYEEVEEPSQEEYSEEGAGEWSEEGTAESTEESQG